MKKNKIIQFSLVIAAITLIFFTYYSSDKDKIIDADKNILIGNDNKLVEETKSNIIENANYVGASGGAFFDLTADTAEVKHDEPNISHLENVIVVIKIYPE